MFSSLLDKIGVMEVIAPMTESHPLVIAMQRKDFGACVTALETGEVKGLTRTRCGPIHLAADADFVIMIDYLINNQISNVSDVDEEFGDSALHYASRKGHMDSLSKLVSLNGDVLLKNKNGQTPYDVASNLSIRQYLLPLQLRTESDRGLAPVLPGVTTAQSLGMGGPSDCGPPPPMMSYGTPSAPPPGYNTQPPPPGVYPQQIPPQQQQPVWQPPHPDGFASGSTPVRPPGQQQCGGDVGGSGPGSGNTMSSPAPMQPPPFNQFSAFGATAGANSRSLSGRYVDVSYGQPQQQQHQPPPYQQQHQGVPVMNNYSQPVAYQLPQPQYTTFQPNSPHSPQGGGELEEVSLSSTSSSVM